MINSRGVRRICRDGDRERVSTRITSEAGAVKLDWWLLSTFDPEGMSWEQQPEEGEGGADLWESASAWWAETLANEPNEGSEDQRTSSTFVLMTGRRGKVLLGVLLRRTERCGKPPPPRELSCRFET